MNDLEITRLCASAMGYTEYQWPINSVVPDIARPNGHIYIERNSSLGRPMPPRSYRPLHDDAQCMALVKKFELWIDYAAKQWVVREFYAYPGFNNADLNIAVCECVAKMQASK